MKRGAVPIVVAVAALAAVAAWVATRPASGPGDATRPGGAAAGGGASPPAHRAPAAPTVGGGPGPAGGAGPSLRAPSVAEAWAGQARDEAWAAGVEAELAQRLAPLAGQARVEDASCRQSACRISLAGDLAAVGDAIARMETDDGLRALAAASLLLTAPERRPDGGVVLRAYALFDR